MSNDLTKAKELICNYSLEEFGYEPDFRNLSSIEVAYTTTDNDYPIQAAIDLNKLNINKYINYILVEQRHYPSMQELIDGELYALDFNDLTAYTDEQLEYAKKVAAALEEENVLVTVDSRNEKIGYRIREAQLSKVPYMVCVGADEQENGTVAVRARKEGEGGVMTIDEFIAKVKDETKTFKKW